MLADNFYRWALPSFIERAQTRLGELAFRLVAIQLTEPWQNRATSGLLLEAKLLRHGLRSLRHADLLSTDEKRYIVERLLPLLPDTTGDAAPAPPAPLFVPVSLLMGLPSAQGIGGTVETGELTPTGSVLIVLRNTGAIQEVIVPRTGAFRLEFTDAQVGVRYTAQLWFKGQLLGQATKFVTAVQKVYWGSAPNTIVAPATAAAYQNAPLAAVGVGQQLDFTLAAGRQNVYIILPATVRWQLRDPRLNNVEVSNIFNSEAFVLDGQPVQLLRQQRPVIGPVSFPLTLIIQP